MTSARVDHFIVRVLGFPLLQIGSFHGEESEIPKEMGRLIKKLVPGSYSKDRLRAKAGLPRFLPIVVSKLDVGKNARMWWYRVL